MAKISNERFSSTTSEMQGFFERWNISFFITDHYFTCRYKSKNVGIRADYGTW